jgi:hypothetical protein
VGLDVVLGVRAGALLAISTLAGCGCESPPIWGGDAGTQSTITRALEDFFDAVPDDRVCVSHIAVHDLEGPVVGRYRRIGHTITVEERSDLDDAEAEEEEWSTTTHELCHAGQYQTGIDVSDDVWWIEDSDIPEGLIPHEAFAYTCQVGAEVVQLVGAACPDDPPGAEAFQLISDQLFTVPNPRLGSAALEWEAVASAYVPGAEMIGFDALGTVGDSFRLALRDGSWIGYLQAATGESGSLSPKPALGGLAVELHAVSIQASASTDSAEILVFEARAANGAVARRLAWYDGTEVTPLGCPRPQETVFVLEDELWSIYADGDTVTWGYWRAP